MQSHESLILAAFLPDLIFLCVVQDAGFQRQWRRYGMEVDLKAGETLFLPRLWPHAVLNTEETVAVVGQQWYQQRGP